MLRSLSSGRSFRSWSSFMLVASALVNQLRPRAVTSAWLSSSSSVCRNRSGIALYFSSMTNPQSQVLARKVSPEDWKECGARLRNGDLVAFPTETVYGLGCHALDPLAVAKVFAAKERPLTDPLIVHVTSTSDAQRLWAATPTSAEGVALQILCNAFWPGPLTLVAKASSDVPPLVMANTGFVACRAPSHPLARQLIDAAEVPIAAPSANKFGHVSPTRAHHVWDDLQYEDVWIVDAPSVCEVGVESTVAKMEFDSSGNNGKITVLRQGAVSGADLESCLLKAGLGDKITVVTSTRKATKEDVATVAPGQCFRHYAPDIPSYILSSRYQTPTSRTNLSTTVVIDYHCKLVSLKGATLAYRDLSASGDSAEAARSLFETLRWAEQVEGATRIWFPELHVTDQTDALVLALKDRLTRAASGIIIDNLGNSIQS